MEGPKGLLFYLGDGDFALRKNPIKKTKIGLIAGGTGITPCFQIIQSSSLAKDALSIVMLYSNKTESDILLKEELEFYSKINAEHFKIFHTLTRQEEGASWIGFKGRITDNMIQTCGFPEPSPETLICYCGPAAFNKTVEDIMVKLGYSKDMLHKF